MIDINKNIEMIKNDKNIIDKHKEDLINLLNLSLTITFGKQGRTEGYFFKNNPIPRCTSILKMDGSKADGLMIWAKKEVAQYAKDKLTETLNNNGLITGMDISLICQEALANPDKQRDSAADVGSKKHDKVEYWLNNQKEKPSDDIIDFVNIWKKENCSIVCTEMPLAFMLKDGRGFGGKLDILAYKNGKLRIYDNKTSRAVYQSYGIQVSGYAGAVNQMLESIGSDLRVDSGKIIHMPDRTLMSPSQIKEFEKRGMLVECKNLDEGLKHLLNLLELYYKRNNKYLC